ncbi:MAG: 50S ribosomal protein L23 [Candidatus Liptonbacteria bacterium]|nr:50S ribosomal protein L23 [Candidatus Liptonbacteria bacterium]
MENFIIKRPIITEKTTEFGRHNKYAFVVHKDVSSAEIKKALKKIYGVDVLKVNILNIPPKLGYFKGKPSALRKQGYKKAIATIKEGQSIDVIAH